MDLRLGWRNRDKGLVESQPSMLGRARRERRLRGMPPQSEENLRDAPAAPVSNGPAQSLDEAISTASLGADGVVREPLSADGEATASLSAEGDAGLGEQDAEQATPVPREAEFAEGFPEAESAASLSTQAEGEQDPAAEGSAAVERPGDLMPGPVTAQLGRLAAQLQGLQQQLDAFIAGRGRNVAEQASQHVATIVAAAEESAAEIRARAEKDASAMRERLLADVQAEVERIRSEAQADAGRIRTEAHAQAARLRERTIARATAEIDAFVARLAEDIQAAARATIAGIGYPPSDTAATAPDAVPAAPSTAPAAPQAPPEAPAYAAASSHDKPIADEVEEALDDLQLAAVALEESLRHLRAGEEQPLN